MVLPVVVSAVMVAPLAQRSVTPTDGEIIGETLRVTALQEIARLSKPSAPAAVLTLVNQSVAVCDVMPPNTFCLDYSLKTLDVLRQRGGWPAASLVAALRERNKASESLAHLQLEVGSFVPRGERGSQRANRSVAQVCLPVIEGDVALIVVIASFAGSQVWAVELNRRDGRWRAIRTEHLVSGG
jgi:hypothetical protein